MRLATHSPRFWGSDRSLSVYKVQDILLHLPESIRGAESVADGKDAEPTEGGAASGRGGACEGERYAQRLHASSTRRI